MGLRRLRTIAFLGWGLVFSVSGPARELDFTKHIYWSPDVRIQESRSGTSTFLSVEWKRFDNGNIFVRLPDDIYGKRLSIELPARVGVDEFVESLFVARTARSLGVDEVSFRVEKNAKLQVVDSKGKVISAQWRDALDISAGTRSDLQLLPRPTPVQEGRVFIDDIDHEELAGTLSRETGIARVPDRNFRARGSRIYLILSQRPERSNDSFLRALAKIQRYRNLGCRVHLVTPYLPYARSDKVDQKGVAVTGRLVADLFEGYGAAEISFVRAHAPQSQGFFSIPATQLWGRETITQELQSLGVEVVVSPDAGFQKDATLYADGLGVPVGVMNKQRDPRNAESRLRGFSGPNLRGKRVAIIDDETATGGTLAKVAEFLKARFNPSMIVGVVTHLAGNAKKALESNALQKVIVTNTIPLSESAQAEKKLRVLDITGELKDLIQRLETQRRASILCDTFLVKGMKRNSTGEVEL